MTDQNRSLAGGDQDKLLNLIIKESKDGMIVIDEEGVIRFANPAAKRMFSNQPDSEELIGYQIGMPAIEDDVELQIPRKGEIRHIELRVSKLDWKGETAELAMLRDITQRKTAQRRLKESEQKYRHLFSHSINGFALHEIVRDEQGEPVDYVFLEVNQAFEVHTGLKIEDVVGKRASEVLIGVQETELLEIYAQVATTGEPVQFEFYSPQLKRHFLISAYSPREDQFATIFYDISERVETEKALQKSEQKYRTLYETMAQGVVYQNAEGEITSANPAAERILGLSLDQMQGKTSMDPDWQAVTLDGDPLPGEQHPGMVALRTGEKVKNHIFGVYQPEKEDHVWISVSAIPQFREGEEEPYQVFTTFLDITDQVRAEKDLKERVKELRCLVAVGEMIQRDPPLEKVGQITVDLLVPAMQYPEITVPVVEINGERFEHKRYDEGLTHKLQARVRTRSEDYGHVTVYYAKEKPFIIPEEQNLIDQIAEMLALWYEQETTQERLRFQSHLLDAVGQAVVATDPEGKIVYWNDAAEKYYGWSASEVQGKNILEVTPAEGMRDQAEEILTTLMAGEMWTGQFEVQRKDGTTFPAIVTDSPVVDEEGELEGIIGVTTDISERVVAENALQRSEERFRALIENAQDMIAVVDEEGVLQYTSPAVESILGYTPEEQIGKKAIDFIHPQDLPMVQEYFQERSNQPGVLGRMEFRMQNTEGEWRVIESVSRNALDEPGVEGIVVNLRDVTQRHEYEKVIENQVEQLSIQHEIASMGVELEDLDTIIAKTTSLIKDTFNPENCGFLILKEGDTHLKPHPSYNIDPELQPFSLQIGEGVIGTVAETGKSINIPDVRESDIYREINPTVRSELCVPVQSTVRMWGVLNIESTKTEAFSAEDEALMNTIANQLATVLDRIQSIGEAQRRMDRLQALREIDRTISGSLDLKTTLDVLISHLIQTLEVDAGNILLYQDHLQSLSFIAGEGFIGEKIKQTKMRLGKGYAGRVALKQEIVRVRDLTLETIQFDRAQLIREEGFKSYCGVPLVAKGKLVGVLEVFHRSLLNPTPEWVDFLETLAGQAAIAIDRLDLFERLQRSNVNLMKAYNDVIEGWARALELRDQETEGHSRRVEKLTVKIARRMGIKGDDLGYCRQGALLHDIGKMGIPDQILQKPGKLTDEEWEIMKKHPEFSYNLLSSIEYLKPALDIPYCHHEKWDGSGYPQGLEGEGIPLPARIFAVVDVWDALRSDRPYREAWTDERALSYIKEQSGKHFDPNVVRKFLEVIAAVDRE